MSQPGDQVDRKIILIVDDDVAYCAAMGEILDSAGFNTLSAFSVNEALWILTDTKPDIILSDTMMPHTDGGSLLRILRRVERFRAVPVVTVSAKAMPSDRAEALAAGANGFLAKPFTARELLDEIGRHVDRRDQQAA
ncbi:MAG TPA: response regulator [Anaerolineales bacterium]|nr:response regulator [Anaerolineales bacterium]